MGKDKSGQNVVVIYAVTGRSSSSQGRRIDHEGGDFYVKPAGQKSLNKGKESLLVYPALCMRKGIAASNGLHTRDILEPLGRYQNPAAALISGLSQWDYEPDPPHFTSRISGVVLSSHRGALGLIKRASDGNSMRNYFEFPLRRGTGKMVATYKGKNQNPLPSFEGEPWEVKVSQPNPEKAAQEIYEALGPSSGKEDYRVSVVCVYCRDVQSSQYSFSIINRCDRRGE